MAIPATIIESRSKAIARAAGLLVLAAACVWVLTLGGSSNFAVGLGVGVYCLISLCANLWIAWKPGGVVLTAQGLEVRRPWGKVSLPWKEVAGASVCRSRLAGEIIMAPFNGFRWVEIQRRNSGAPIIIVGSELAPQALTDLIINGRTEWLANERAKFDEAHPFPPAPLIPAMAGGQAESGPGSERDD